ncbi:unnamed protein product [Soboliphyme baturini]|uniref:Type VI secretion protein n=1 Tax=Soboliphyme baturini TaxID=241478 RepID=A0A183IEZ9_9BILA|nr:unnamed protein product [Soboliphyme baturini]
MSQSSPPQFVYEKGLLWLELDDPRCHEPYGSARVSSTYAYGLSQVMTAGSISGRNASKR